MKNIKILILFLFVCHLSFSQAYKPMLKADSTTWHIVYLPTSSYGIYHHTGILYNKQADTIINGKQYSEIFESFMFTSPGPFYSPFYLAEDTLTGKAWIYKDGDGESLIMDLMLSLGDTFFIYNGSTNYTIVDSVYYYAGLKHVRMDYTQLVYSDSGLQEIPLIFIEGIGPNFSPIFNLYSYGLNNHPFFLLCKYEDSLQTFHLDIDNQSGSNECEYWFSSDIDENQKEKINIFVSPNPFTNNIRIENKNAYDVEYIIYNSLGQKITMPTKINGLSSSEIVNMEGMHSGIYFVHISSENARRTTLKIIKY
jgi:Secretion system C-terminal sorting domain